MGMKQTLTDIFCQHSTIYERRGSGCEGGFRYTREVRKAVARGLIKVTRERFPSWFGKHIRRTYLNLTDKGKRLLETKEQSA